MIRRLAALMAWSLIAGCQFQSASAVEHPEGASPSVIIGYVELEGDSRYGNEGAYAGIVYRTLGRPFPGAELGVEDARVIGQVMGRSFAIERKSANGVEELHRTVSDWVESGVRFVIADLPSAELVALAEAVAEMPVLLMNISASDDHIRGAECRTNIAHFIPSRAMLADALVQYLVARKWTRILVLKGPAAADEADTKALTRSAARFGATITQVRSFVLGSDPRQRSENNIALVTGDSDADVVYVADASGEFARYVPYQTASPLPVVGDAGLSPVAWHWSWYRHGAPQLPHRFEELAPPRRMNSSAWAAWAAVKAVTQAAMRARSPSFQDMRDYILGDAMNLDGAKGNPMSVRSWDQQLRQPILLATPDAVIARAPLPQFLHQHDILDTLGHDEPESACRIAEGGAAGVAQ